MINNKFHYVCALFDVEHRFENVANIPSFCKTKDMKKMRTSNFSRIIPLIQGIRHHQRLHADPAMSTFTLSHGFTKRRQTTQYLNFFPGIHLSEM